MTLVQTEPKKITMRHEVPLPDYLCFTANTSNSTVTLNKNGSPATVTLEISTDSTTWTDYTIGTTITLSSIGDKVYWRSKTARNSFSSNDTNWYQFSMSGSIDASGSIMYLLSPTGTGASMNTYCFYELFLVCTSLRTAPKLPSTSVTSHCYDSMFRGCTNLETIPTLPRKNTLPNYCYYQMFNNCTKIKLSETQTGEYTNEYRIPPTGTGTVGSNSLKYMFTSTGGTFTGDPSINTTYYTSNTVVDSTASVPTVQVEKEIKRITIRPNGQEKQIRPVVLPYLCFTANTASSSVQLNKNLYPTSVNLETSTDGNTWSDYTIGNAITLANVGDKVYMRNKSETDTGFSTSSSNYYQFSMTGSISASGDITTLLNKNGTTTLSSNNCYYRLFYNCTNLITAPSLPATTLQQSCYNGMFYGCTSLITLPELPATTLATQCYYQMFRGCTSIKLSTTQTGEYQTEYRIPTTGTGTTASSALDVMFSNTSGTFTGTPTVNTTYYTSNTLV